MGEGLLNDTAFGYQIPLFIAHDDFLRKKKPFKRQKATIPLEATTKTSDN